jgi:tRNA threonylcarbamoyladenosine modification (KEOPS) complex Cgi121 subunit
MQYYLEEYGKHVESTGYRNIAFAQAEAFLKAHRKQTLRQADIQFFDAQFAASPEHLYFAVLNALQAFQNKTSISKSAAVETMLYASAERQIQKAIDRIGIKPQTKNMAVVIIGEDPKQTAALLKALTECVGVEPDETVLELTQEKETKIRQAFQITDEELKTLTKSKAEKAVVNLVIERVALLAAQL